MTREEFKEKYKESLIGIWDSIRSTHKGEKTCRGVNCRDCPFDDDICNMHDAIEIVEQWTNQHKIKTNSQKFKEVFGFEPTPIYCVNNNVKCENCEYFDYNDGLCDVGIFWDAEYMPPTKEGE